MNKEQAFVYLAQTWNPHFIHDFIDQYGDNYVFKTETITSLFIDYINILDKSRVDPELEAP